MPFQRQYTKYEVQGMLKIFQGNRAFQGFQNGVPQRANAPAHANIHGGANFIEQRARVNTPGQPRATGTYWTEDDQINATMEILNYHLSQVQLRRLDLGDRRLSLEAPLANGRYRISVAEDNSNIGAGVAGHAGRNNPARRGAGSTHHQGFARKGFVLLVCGVGGLLQVQTSYPIM
jgi:hypothetical protein